MVRGQHWGTTLAERSRTEDCDRLIPAADQILTRAIDVAAPAATTFRWLCQLRVAPYSYDLLDNLGRRSPRTLTPGLDEIAVGQRAQHVFRIAGVQPGRSLTMTTSGRLFGQVAITYAADPLSTVTSRLLARVAVRYGPVRGLPALFPAGDLLMMRRQLRTLAALAEGPPGPGTDG